MPGFCPLPPEELAGGGDGRWNGEDTPNKVIQDSDVRKCLDIWKKRKLQKKRLKCYCSGSGNSLTDLLFSHINTLVRSQYGASTKGELYC